MENYIVSARKYRPATFESVVGQHALTITLKNAIATGKLAIDGLGKDTCTRCFSHSTRSAEQVGMCQLAGGNSIF